ncbi:MAG: YicC/YloC family endoribonuclease [Oscillospiraceae bacterium]|nr:YicC/YloC family endoribonuclease [Oscillospiraceae bacterium]
MIRSMTGFGRDRMILNGREILVEIKSVNHRFNEVTARVPRQYLYIEEPLKKIVSSSISRGKTEVSLTITNVEAADTKIQVNETLAMNYINAMRSVNTDLGLRDDLSLSHLLRFPDVFTLIKVSDNEEQILNDVVQVAQSAVAKFISMRCCEGEKLKEDVLSKLEKIESMVSLIEEKAPEMAENYKNRLYTKISETLSDRTVDEQRLITEVAIFSEKVAVDEETVRLKSHMIQFRNLLDNEDIIGRKLDFLIQEMNREANTIASKAQGLEIIRTVVDIKSEIEKIREQIQNIE